MPMCPRGARGVQSKPPRGRYRWNGTAPRPRPGLPPLRTSATIPDPRAEPYLSPPNRSRLPMSNRRRWIRRGLLAALLGLVAQQAWRHGRDYVFADQFAVVEPGKIYRGAWQQPWPMKRVVQQYKIKTVLALAHPPDHPLAIREKAMAEELGYRWIHIPIVDERSLGDWR